MIHNIRMLFKVKFWVKTLTFLILQSFLITSYADIYKWTDNSGKTHYSDRDTTDRPIEVIDNKVYNLYSYDSDESIVDNYISRKDTYTLPYRNSDVPFSFSLTSGMNQDEPIDSLNSIKINIRQKSFHAYIKLIGAEQHTRYDFRIRILDAEGQLIFDQNAVVSTIETNSAWFVAKISPNVSIDASGQWTFQAILNDKKLFVDKRSVLF